MNFIVERLDLCDYDICEHQVQELMNEPYLSSTKRAYPKNSKSTKTICSLDTGEIPSKKEFVGSCKITRRRISGEPRKFLNKIFKLYTRPNKAVINMIFNIMIEMGVEINIMQIETFFNNKYRRIFYRRSAKL